MINQYIWIGIVITVFFIGIGVSYAHFANTYDPMSMKSQNQELFNQMMSNNPRMSQQWMDSDMNHQMMNDPQMNNPGMMNSGMQDMMNLDMMMQMMEDPETRDEMIQMMSKHVDEMQKLLSSELTEDEFNTQMSELMQEHMVAMKNMMDENMMMSSEMMEQKMPGQNEKKQPEATSSYVNVVNGVQVVTVDAKEFKFNPSEIHIKTGMVKFIMVNSGVGEHELVVYEASKKEIVDKAELAEDEDTIVANILFEIDHTPAGESAESEVITIKEGSYIVGCHIPGHYDAGMKGILYVEE